MDNRAGKHRDKVTAAYKRLCRIEKRIKPFTTPRKYKKQSTEGLWRETNKS